MLLDTSVASDEVIAGDACITFHDSSPAENRRPLVLLHGTGGTAEASFWALFPMLAARHRVVALDFHDPEDPETDSGVYVDQVSEVIARLAPSEPVDLLGYSFGAVIAAMFAARHPEMVRSLTLVAGWLKTDAHQQVRSQLWFSLRDSAHPALAEFMFFATYSARYVNSLSSPEIARLIERLRDGPDRSAKMRFNRSVDITHEASRISAPTLVIGCGQDQMVPLRHSQLLFGAISDARLGVIDSGHGVVWERPAELFTMVDGFVRDPQGLPAGSIVPNHHA